MDGTNNGYLELLNLTEIHADQLDTPYITCNTLTASVGNITTGNITTINSTNTNTTNASIDNLTIPTLTANKLVLSNGSDKLISSAYTDTDMAIKSLANTFTQTNTFSDIVLNNAKVSLGSTQTTTGLTTGCLIGNNLSNGGFNNVGMINSTGTLITAQGANRFYVSQLRNAQLNAGILLYDNTTKEVSYSATLPTFTTSGLTITGLTADRAVITNASKALTSATFNLPNTSGTNGYLLLTDGVATTSWTNPATLPAITSKAPINNPTFTGQVTLPLGTATAPSLRFDSDTGLYSTGDGNMSFSRNGVEILNMVDTLNPKVQIRHIAGLVGTPAYSFLQDIDSGMYQGTAGEVDFSCNSQNILNLSTSGVKIPTLNPSKLVLSDANDRLTSSTYGQGDLAILGNSNTFTGSNNSFVNITASGFVSSDTRIINNYELLRNIIRFYPPVLEICPNTPAFSDPFVPANTTNNGLQLQDGNYQATLYFPARNGVAIPNGQPWYIRMNSGLGATQSQTGSDLGGNLSLAGSYSNLLYVFVYNSQISLYQYMGYVSYLSIPTSLQFNGRGNSYTLPSIRGNANNILTTDGAGTTSWATSISTGNITSSGVITMPLGVVGTPSLTFSGDTNTGIFSAGADTMNLVSNATTRLSISNSGVNVPNLTASRVVLTDASDNLISSSYTDLELLNNKMVETCKAPLSLLTFTNQQVFYCPIYIDKTQTFSSIYFGFSIPAGATNLNPYMGLATLAVYNASSLTDIHPNFISSSVSTKITATDTGELGLFLINNPTTKSYNTMYKHTYSSPFSLSAGRYFLALLMESAAPAAYLSAFQASFTSNSASMNITAFNLNTISITAGSSSVLADVTHSGTTSFTYNVSGTSLSVTSTPTPYLIFPGCYLNSILGGLYIVSQASGATGGIGLYTISQSVSSSSGTMNLNSSRYSANVNSLGTGTGRTGTYTMSVAFAPIVTGSITGTASAVQFTHTAATTASYVPLGITTSNSYNYQQTALTSLPSTATPVASTSMPYMALST